MELIYAAMLLHKAGKEINEENVKKVIEAVGLKIDDAQIKALVAALDGVNIEDAIKEASIAPATAPAVSAAESGGEAKKEEKKEEKKDDVQAAAGLGALFG